jgi:hypothetical protein
VREGAFSDYQLEADRTIAPGTLPLRERPQAADTEQATEDQQNKNKFEARQASEFWRSVMRTAIGRREIFKLLNMVRAFESSPFAATPIGFPDPQATFFNMGQIEQGRAVYQMLAIVARDELFALQDEFNVFGALATRPDRLD